MRRFALESKSGEVYNLDSLDNFLHDPDGLGFRRSTEYRKIGLGYEVVQDSFEQPDFRAQICFKDRKISPAYQKYEAFSRFLQDTPHILHYYANRHYKMNVMPKELTKTEVSKPLGLNVDIGLDGLSLWYEEIEATGTNSLTMLCDSRNESGCHIEIKGAITNPIWSQTVNGVTITGKVNATLASGDTLHIRTDTNPYQLYKVSSGGSRTDLYGSSDFSTERFVLLKYGQNTISCSGATSIKVTGRVMYETV